MHEDSRRLGPLLMMFPRSRRRAALLLGVSTLAVCAVSSAFASDEAQRQGKPFPAVISVRIGIINYLDDGVVPVFIEKGWASGAHGGAYSSGTCCVRIPSHWKPGTTMTVSWSTDTLYLQGNKTLRVREAPVLPYEPFYDGFVWVVFLPSGDVFLQPAGGGPGMEGFLQGLPPPHEHPTDADFRAFIERNAQSE